jgi:hypothetical protein
MMSRRIIQRTSKQLRKLVGREVTIITDVGSMKEGRLLYDGSSNSRQGYYLAGQHLNLKRIRGVNPSGRKVYVNPVNFGVVK